MNNKWLRWEKMRGGKIKMPRKMCMDAQNSGHALEPMVAFEL
jgi:hypothetical protein